MRSTLEITSGPFDCFTLKLMNAPLTARQARREVFESNKLAKRLRREVGQAIADYAMIEAGDKVMVCLSGGKDSYAMLDVLLYLREHAPIEFEIIAVNLDQKQPGFPAHILPAYLTELGVAFHIEDQDTYSIVKRVIPEGKTTCSLCSRLRRGVLYRVASELGATKIALGHHRDDIVQTLFLNLFFGSKLKTMPPKLVSDDGRHIVIRPLAYCRETDLELWATQRQYPIIPCEPGRVNNLFRGLANVVPSHLLDTDLYDFRGLVADGVANPDGDLGFDPPSFPAAVSENVLQSLQALPVIN
ncbi:MAG: tRNA 2-thiocytidine(32) synthetase TtcA [Rhodocyclaceae bacterium]|nr:tRNA 2-thiocytidine(32) synthetase TtcA [Rhodocyclaceae bacterium]